LCVQCNDNNVSNGEGYGGKLQAPKKKLNNKKIKREKKDYLYPISSRDFCLTIEHGIYLYVSCPSIDYYINPYCRRVAIVPCL